MKLPDLKDSNGTSIQSYAETLVEKCAEHDLISVLLFISKDSKHIHAIAPMPSTMLPQFLKELVHQMRKPPKGESSIKLTDAPEN